jgi:hypothetical protein
VTRARARDLAPARIDEEVEHRDELARADLVHDHLVRIREERRRIRPFPRERAEAELRHRHVGRCLDPLSGHVAEKHREAAALEGEEVVHVAAHLHARRGLVQVPDVETGNRGKLPREQRPLHRLGEVLLLLVEARVVDRKGSLRRDDHRRVDVFRLERPGRIDREQSERPENLTRLGHRKDGGGRALDEKGVEEPMHVLFLSGTRHEPDGPPGAEEAAGERRGHRLRAAENRRRRIAERRVGDVDSARLEHVAALVGHPDRGRIDLEEVDHRLRDGVERRLERQALRERA